MAKYCSKCGRALPEGVEICPDCHGADNTKDDAALFTRITAETEVWKDTTQPEKREKRRKKMYSMRERLMLYLAAVLLVIFTVFIIYYTLPSSRVVRAIDGERFDKAMLLYTEKLADKGEEKNARVAKALVAKAESICRRYESGELEREDGETLFAGLYAFGIAGEELDRQYESLQALEDMRGRMENAEKLCLSGKYLEACDIYLSICAEQYDYAEAQTKLSECFELYGQGVAEAAQTLMDGQDYQSAAEALLSGNEALGAYDTFSAVIDAKLSECCSQYEAFAISEAENLAALDKYSEAAALLRECMDSPVGETQTLYEAYEGYVLLSENQASNSAIKKSGELYAAGEYENAFTELETAGQLVEDASLITAAISALERRYVSDMCEKADKLVGGERSALTEAIAFLEQAQQIRRLDGIDEHITELEGYLPLDIVTAPFSDREGEVFRSTGSFYAVGGTIYQDGWLWGANGASISYSLDGKYDLLEGDFGVRREDGTKISGYFEVWCDGELKYTSETLEHSTEPQGISYDISGCMELKLVFYCDYNTVTGDGGYCYHGICSPAAVKRLPASLSVAE